MANKPGEQEPSLAFHLNAKIISFILGLIALVGALWKAWSWSVDEAIEKADFRKEHAEVVEILKGKGNSVGLVEEVKLIKASTAEAKSLAQSVYTSEANLSQRLEIMNKQLFEKLLSDRSPPAPSPK